jgi:hypothetical protein
MTVDLCKLSHAEQYARIFDALRTGELAKPGAVALARELHLPDSMQRDLADISCAVVPYGSPAKGGADGHKPLPVNSPLFGGRLNASSPPGDVVAAARESAVRLRDAFVRRDGAEAALELSQLAALLHDSGADHKRYRVTTALAWALGGWSTDPAGSELRFAIHRTGSPALEVDTKGTCAPSNPHHDQAALDWWRATGTILRSPEGRISAIRYNADERIGHNDWDFYVATVSLPAGVSEMWNEDMSRQLRKLLDLDPPSDVRRDVTMLLLLTSKAENPLLELPTDDQRRCRNFTFVEA